MDSQQLLKQTGIKLTSSRKEILKALSSSPLSSQEVHQLLKQKGIDIDLATVYRTLELFVSLGLVAKIQLEDQISRFELKNNHHHHLICIKCGLIEDIEMNEKNFISQIEKKSQFKLQRHSLEFFGLCGSCQKLG